MGVVEGEALCTQAPERVSKVDADPGSSPSKLHRQESNYDTHLQNQVEMKNERSKIRIGMMVQSASYFYN